MQIAQVLFTKRARKGLEKAPKDIRLKLATWVEEVESLGLDAANAARPGLRPHLLTGKLQGLWAICLNERWRAIYEVSDNQVVITILEVTHHDYRTR
jgi:addiction module RelE/StbE family toxin